jgi:hypothetical protein
VKIGENVLHPVVRLASKQPLTLLRVLLAGYVYHHANKAIRLGILAIQAFATRLDPADSSVLSYQSVFLSILLLGGDGVVDSIGDPLNILGMDTREVIRQRRPLLALRSIDRASE